MALRDGINPNRVTYSAEQIASKTNVKPSDVDKAIAQMGPGDLGKLLPEISQYLRGCAEAVFNMCDRMQESAFRTQPATSESPLPHHGKWFTARDTSQLPPYEGRLPFNEISPENLQNAVRSGLLTREQGQALAYMFGFMNPPEGKGLQTQSGNMQGGQGQSGERGMQDNQGSDQNPDDEWNEMNIDEIGGSGGGGGGLGSAGKAMTGGPSTAGKTMTGSGGPAGGGAPPPPPGGAFPGGPPPPPPGGAMSGGKNTPYDEYNQKISGVMQQETNYLNANFTPGDPYHGWFQTVFTSENWYRNFSAKGLTELNGIRDAKSRIMAELNGIDSSSPQGAKKLYILQQKLGELQMSERQIYDHISTAQKANNERKELIKSILDMVFQTSSAMIRNIGR